MIPLSDDNPTLRTPIMTYLILAVTWGVWILVQGAGVDQVAFLRSLCNLGMIPGELTGQASLGSPVGRIPGCFIDDSSGNFLTPLTSMFMHGSWAHIIGNSLFFWVFGNNIEDSMGRVRFVAFYLICGLAAAAAHVFVEPGSPIPTVGASGAISGIMGAYLVLYPRVYVNMLFILFIFIRVIPLPAWMVLIWWFGIQVLTGLPGLLGSGQEASGGVAVWAHVGGFVAGLALVKLFENYKLVAQRESGRHRLHPRHP